MMDLRIAAVDDRQEDLQYIGQLVHRWADQRRLAAEFSSFLSAEAYLFQREGEAADDILILDIEMAGMDGLTLAGKIRENNSFVQIVFLSGYSDYIASGYDVAALHYLLKPVDETKLFSVLDRAVKVRNRNEKTVLAERNGEMVRIPVPSIRYAEVHGNYVTIHADEAFTVRMTLTRLEQQLDERFFHAGRSLLVNLTMIARIRRKEIVMRDGTVLPLGRGGYEKVSRALIEME